MDHPARRTRRRKIFQPVLLIDGRGERRAHLLDISETGALVHCDPGCEKGEPVQIRIDNRLLGARIVWSTPPRFGIAFAQPLSVQVVSALLEARP